MGGWVGECLTFGLHQGPHANFNRVLAQGRHQGFLGGALSSRRDGVKHPPFRGALCQDAGALAREVEEVGGQGGEGQETVRGEAVEEPNEGLVVLGVAGGVQEGIGNGLRRGQVREQRAFVDFGGHSCLSCVGGVCVCVCVCVCGFGVVGALGWVGDDGGADGGVGRRTGKRLLVHGHV